MRPKKVRTDCLYCSATANLTDEHLFPLAIGGVRFFHGVCKKCNNETLSRLDTELCKRSILSLISGPALHGSMDWVWDVDHSSSELLLEGRGDAVSNSMTQWPQLVFDRQGPQFHADQESMNEYGADRTTYTFIRHMRHAVAKFKHTQKGLFFRAFPHSADLSERYRFPPRIFVERMPYDFSADMTFIVGFLTDADKRRLLNTIDQWDDTVRFDRREIHVGSNLPVVRNQWDHMTIVRALTKIGLNLIFDSVDRTEVGLKTFSPAIEFVQTGRGITPRFLALSGFVWADDMTFLKHGDGGHAFRLTAR